MSYQGRTSTNPRGRGGRRSSLPHPYRGNSQGDSSSPPHPDLRPELDSLKQQIGYLTGENDKLNKQVSEATDNNRFENNQNIYLRSELNEVQSKYAADQNTIVSFNEEWEKLTNEKRELEVRLKKASESAVSSSEQYHLLEANHDDVLKELDAVRDECASLGSANRAQTAQIKQTEQGYQACEAQLNERIAESMQRKEQIDQQQLEITKLHSQVENGINEILALRQKVTGSQQTQIQDGPASQTLTVIGTDADEQAIVHDLIDQMATQVTKWQSDFEAPGAAIKPQGAGNDIKQFIPHPEKDSEAAVSQNAAPNDDEISAASMEIYSKLVRRSTARNKANLEACIRICNHLDVSPGNLRRALKKQVPEDDHDLDVEQLMAKLKKLNGEDAATMQSARGILKNAGITEATLRELPGRVHDNELQDVVDILLSKWQAKGTSAAHTGSRGAGGNLQPAQYSSTDTETQTDATPESSHAAIQTNLVGSPTYVDIGVQHDAAVPKRLDYINSMVQTEPNNIQDSGNVLSYSNKGIQTQRRPPPSRSILIFLFSLFVFLCGWFLTWAISSQLAALRERAMWLDANDMSRRATIYFIDASAHGRRLGWLWQPIALNHIEKPYYYAESMVGFGVNVQ